MGRWRLRLPAVARSLQILAVLLLVAVVGVTVHQLVRTRETLLDGTANEMARLDMVFAEQTGRAVETVDLLLRNAIETIPPTDRAAPATSALLARRIDGVRQVLHIDIVDADGRLIASSSRQLVGQDLPPQGQTLLRYHRTHDTADLQISEPLRTEDGRWTALMTRRISAPDGGFAGITAAALNLAYFEDFYRSVELDQNGAIVLHRRDGTVLARYPHVDDAEGASFANLPPFAEVLSHAMAGTVIMDSPIDGSRRVLAIRALRAFPLAVNISVDEGRVLADWRRQTWIFTAAALTASLAVGWLLLLLAKRSRQVEALLRESQAANQAAEQANVRLTEQMEERARAEAALRQAQRIEAVGQLTGGVAHDFNNLLTVVLGNIELLSRSPALGRDALGRLAIMRAAAERGATLTAQLLAFARRQPLVPRDVDIETLLADMTNLLQSALGSRVRIVLDIANDVWPALVDPTQLELVILNLAINARDAMPSGGVVTVSAANCHRGPAAPPFLGAGEDPPEGDYVAIGVSDTGTGMPPEVLAKVFEPFFTTKGPGAGSGLGLSQVFGVARQSGGGVRIDSTPGIGTRVTVLVPRGTADSTAIPRPPTDMARARSKGATVLVVDDDQPVRDTTAEIVRGLGYDVHEAANGAAALAMLADGLPIDVLLTDVAMPEMSGPDLARQVLLLRPGLPIVFISGYADPDSIAGEARLQRLVLKPFRPRELAAQLAQALASVPSPETPNVSVADQVG
jgi:signal transduction histidine kinase/CheY-like chemotaxis protein